MESHRCGIAGFGARGQIHTTTLVELGGELPIAIIFVDRADRVARIMPQITAMARVGLISTTPVNVIQTSHRTPGAFPPHLTVADVMTRDAAQVQPDTPVREIVSLLIDRALRAVPVVDTDRHVVGIITDGDLLTRDVMDLSVEVQRALPLPERAAQMATLEDQPHRAADLMTPNPIAANRCSAASSWRTCNSWRGHCIAQCRQSTPTHRWPRLLTDCSKRRSAG